MKKTRKKRDLTPKEEKFCNIIILMEKAGKLEKRRAYEMVYNARGKTAAVEASRTLSRPQVKKFLAHARAQYRGAEEKKQEKTRADIIAEYEIMAFARPSNYYNADGTPKKLKELTKDQRAALKSISVVEHHYTNKKGRKGKTVKTEYIIQPKKSSLDALAKIKGMMVERVIIEPSDIISDDECREIRQRLLKNDAN